MQLDVPSIACLPSATILHGAAALRVLLIPFVWLEYGLTKAWHAAC
jgi:hypothetical protein